MSRFRFQHRGVRGAAGEYVPLRPVPADRQIVWRAEAFIAPTGAHFFVSGYGSRAPISDPEFLRLYRKIIAEAVIFSELAGTIRKQFNSTLTRFGAEAIRKAHVKGQCPPGDPEVIASCLLWSPIVDVFLKGLSSIEQLAANKGREAYVELVLQTFLGGREQ